jgi:hypothetical protein
MLLPPPVARPDLFVRPDLLELSFVLLVFLLRASSLESLCQRPPCLLDQELRLSSSLCQDLTYLESLYLESSSLDRELLDLELLDRESRLCDKSLYLELSLDLESLHVESRLCDRSLYVELRLCDKSLYLVSELFDKSLDRSLDKSLP